MDWLAGHKGILFKVVHAYAFDHADRQDLFQEIAIQVWGWRINNEPFSDQWAGIVGGIFVCAVGSVTGVWTQRRSMERDLLPRKRRLEALLKELDAP